MSSRLSTISGAVLLVGGALLTALWTVGAAPWTERAAGCHPIPGVARGVYHVHPTGHDGRDRSARVLEAADSLCLDFVVSTDHHGHRSAIHGLETAVVVLDGAEWTVDGRHHHGQLSGVFDGEENPFRVLNHPAWSGIRDWSTLPDGDRALARAGRLGIEMRNTTRLLRTPHGWGWLASALAVGTGRPNRFLNALSHPTPALDVWRSVQAEVAVRVPALCGSDAHGGATDYADFFAASLLHVPRPSDESVAGYAATLAAGTAWCVDEHLGSPGRVHAALDACTLELEATLPGGAELVVSVAGRERARLGPDALPTQIRLTGTGAVDVQIWRPVWLGVLGRSPRLWALAGVGAIRGCGDD